MNRSNLLIFLFSFFVVLRFGSALIPHDYSGMAPQLEEEGYLSCWTTGSYGEQRISPDGDWAMRAHWAELITGGGSTMTCPIIHGCEGDLRVHGGLFGTAVFPTGTEIHIVNPNVPPADPLYNVRTEDIGGSNAFDFTEKVETPCGVPLELWIALIPNNPDNGLILKAELKCSTCRLPHV